MTFLSADRLIEAVLTHQLLTAAQVHDRLPALRPYLADPVETARELVRAELLTLFQAQMLFAGCGEGLVLGHYTLLDPLGEGGMARVYKARHRQLDRVDAIKLIRPERVASTRAVDRFLREGQAVARLNHPNVVRIHDAGESHGLHYLAMEYVPGLDLAQLVRRMGRLPSPLACHVLQQAAAALQHLHECGVVHRDVKPSNLLVPTALDGVRVLDLGLARVDRGGRLRAGLSDAGLVLGTPDYMAPEQAVDPHAVDRRADIYSLGCTLYFLLAGRQPFPDGTVGQKLAAHQDREPPRLEVVCVGLPAELATVCRRAMAKAPGDRFPSAAKLAEALAPFAPPAVPAAEGALHQLLAAVRAPRQMVSDTTFAFLISAGNPYLPAADAGDFSVDDGFIAGAVEGSLPTVVAARRPAAPPPPAPPGPQAAVDTHPSPPDTDSGNQPPPAEPLAGPAAAARTATQTLWATTGFVVAVGGTLMAIGACGSAAFGVDLSWVLLVSQVLLLTALVAQTALLTRSQRPAAHPPPATDRWPAAPSTVDVPAAAAVGVDGKRGAP